jgi:hypothetical protein
VKILHFAVEIAALLPYAFVAAVYAPLALHGCDRGLVDDVGWFHLSIASTSRLLKASMARRIRSMPSCDMTRQY